MGAKCVYDISTEGKSPAMVEREIIRRIEAHTGRRLTSWQVTVSFHTNPDKKRPTIEIVSLPDIKDRVFLISPPLVTEAQPTLVPLLRRISNYSPKYNRSARGLQFDFVDFLVRVGMSFDRHGGATGVVVQIEYRPCSYTADCERLIAELMERIAAPLVPPPQANHDPGISAAATTSYNYTRVDVDATKFNDKDLMPFSHRTEALLFAKLLRA
ncbi:Mediator of RNA polymerase II transcription subunit 20 [Gracilariopsis chorda]|uniref:Mediator of RNA polymerase II transcription subunit 20 n=1 Tax=Gracilariopsis chorda TaxID=448386 RepID=A0A2V3J0T1_9FLOR|nr:Mediator of RNA polymerase II transcription subunit 20 [Gracilariopsis chorda]|eukprot:PXF47959.1 Mediator of RNA polymerase II transcription subunit 20 [Gracilariopsis chorda]